MRSSIRVSLSAALALAASACAPGSSTPDGFRVLQGTEAAAFVPPADTQAVLSFQLPNATRVERLQQVLGGAKVLGAQLSVVRASNNDVKVVGAHYPTLVATNSVRLTEKQALIIAADRIDAETRSAELMIDPSTGLYFYNVESRGELLRYFHWIDAATGVVLKEYDGLTDACSSAPGGIGTTSGDISLAGLTSSGGAGTMLSTASGRIETHDQGSTRKPFLGPIASDSDGCFDVAGRTSPGSGALVDAHYFASLTDNYFLSQHGFDWVATGGIKMVVHAHYTNDYVNAFWNGSYAAFGDGDGLQFRELTTSDIVAHELTHAVTDFTSDLIYEGQSGALNEAFSDIMGTSVGFWSDTDTNWLLGDGADIRAGENGFRNMADPAEDGDPDHYSERYTGTSDNGGVHINSGIVNHAFYLLVEGGSNAGEARGHTHAAPLVVGIGRQAAADIFFNGFVTLNATATFCDARASTLAFAGAYASNVMAAWAAVGVDDAACGGAPPPPPDPECETAVDCADEDPSNECTTMACNAGVCEVVNVGDDSSCTGGICCTGICAVAACTEGSCADDGDECTSDVCTAPGTCAAQCEYQPTGAPECVPAAFCGDGVCAGQDAGEDGTTCAADCTCKGKNCSKGNCGDYVCSKGESAGNCPIDCN